MIHLILLSGGSGSRLWPLSNSARSKQFLKVLRNEAGEPASMVQRVVSQVARVEADIDITIAACSSQEDSIKAQVEGQYVLVLEPERRDTAPAIMLACANLDYVQNASFEDTVLVMPIDTFADQEYYDQIVSLDLVVQSGMSDLTLLGVEPTYPSEKYGYINPPPREGNVLSVTDFKEKPDEDMARLYIMKGGLWNCGVFGFKLGFLRNLTKKYLDCATYGEMVEHYARLPKNSFDYEVVERIDSAAVLPYSGAWKDLGTWNTLTEELSDWTRGRVVSAGNKNVHAINETNLPLVVAGLKDAVVVATQDGILACSKDASANIKTLIEPACARRPMFEKRRWGEYRVLDSQACANGRNTLIKELIIAAGKRLSYQRHKHRSEIWIVIEGAGEVVIDGGVTTAAPGDVFNIQPLQMHAVRAFESLHIVEIQLGIPLTEEDIERFGDYWIASETL